MGGIKEPQQAEKFLKENWATLVFIGRAFLHNPHWPYAAAIAVDDDRSFKFPDQYSWAIGWNRVFKD